ncbi:MAG: response regulator [Burkholderiaceae bacterium]
MAGTILVVEDELAIQELVSFSLSCHGFSVRGAASVAAARREIEAGCPARVILDRMLPDGEGLAVLRGLRRQPLTQELAVILLTARAGEAERIEGLDAGADDYVSKPFSPRELVARVQALFRRHRPAPADPCLRYGPIVIDPARHQTTVAGQAIPIGMAEFKLLKFLVGEPERVHSRLQLLGKVWGGHAVVEERTVDVHILRLRKTLAAVQAQHLVQTVRGLGYRLSSRGEV